MNQKIFAFICASIIIFSVKINAEPLSQYVNTCKQELGFTSLPELDCYTDGDLFVPNRPLTPINDFVGYKRISDQVDLTFACRWASNNANGTAQSVEMMVHNRVSGKTCFFSARDADNDPFTEVSARMISPTSAQASTYWRQPDEFANGEFQCVSCHVKGPYIVSPRIVSFMGKYGLLNNGHDTFAKKYNAIGESFNQWNFLIDDMVVPAEQTCAEGCHAIGYNSDRPPVTHTDPSGRFTFTVLPSISNVIAEIGNAMPPTNNLFSDYRWINLDTPNSSGDYERLSDVQSKYPHFYCANPSSAQAHIVGSEYIVESAFSDKLRVFNLREGLACYNSDQPSGKCHEYNTRYLCNGKWTEWFNTDGPSGTQDNELRSRISGLCAAPTAMQARINERGTAYSYAPNDKLMQFNNKGLVCRNSDQPNGLCANYTVRFICP